MLQKLKQRKSQSGFTIIEVLIVLAIAGLIILILFRAVPALQRNAHNTSAKDDAAGLLGAVNEFVNNNDGSVPAAQTVSGTAGTNVAYIGGSGSATNCGTAGTNCATAKVGYFDPSKISIVTTIPGTFPAQGSVVIVEGATCSGSAATTTGATIRNYVALYTLEGGAQQCQIGS